MRLLDNNWTYDENLLSNKAGSDDAPLAILTEPRGRRGGLLTPDGFKLHPEGKALFARVSNLIELNNLHTFAAKPQPPKWSHASISVNCFCTSHGAIQPTG